jgi:hypothetical protein
VSGEVFSQASSSSRCPRGYEAGTLGLYFPPEANEAEVAMMPNAELRPIESVWGHLAGGPGFNPPDAAFVDAALGELPGT